MTHAAQTRSEAADFVVVLCRRVDCEAIQKSFPLAARILPTLNYPLHAVPKSFVRLQLQRANKREREEIYFNHHHHHRRRRRTEETRAVSDSHFESEREQERDIY
jgi:hypothetical protein